MSENIRASSKDAANSRLNAIASHITPNITSRVDDVGVKSKNDVVDARPKFALENHPIDEHRRLKASLQLSKSSRQKR